MKLLQTNDYLLLIDEEAEIKGDDFCVNLDRRISHLPLKVEKRNIGGYGSDKYYFSHKKVIAYRKLNENAKELDLPKLPPFEEVDVKKLAKINSEYLADWQDKKFYITSFIEGYKAAQSKQFTLEDMKKAVEMAREYEFVMYGNGETEHKYSEEEIIQSLSTQQLPKKFIPEYEEIPNFERSMGNIQENYKYQIKTITNSESKEVLVGTYKY